MTTTTSISIAEATSQRGWFRPQLMLVESLINGRWAFWLAIKMNGSIGKLPEWQIPQIEFSSIEAGPEQPQRASTEPIDDRMLAELGTRSQARRHVEKVFGECFAAGCSLGDCIAWWLYAFGSPTVKDKPTLPERAEKALFALKLHWLLCNPADWGSYFALLYFGDRSSKQRSNGWFPTPVSVGQLMAELLFAGDDDRRAHSVHDPCLGTAALLLVASNHSLNLSGQDIDPLMCRIAEFQGYLYVPWLVSPGRDVREIAERNRPRKKRIMRPPAHYRLPQGASA